MTSTMCTRCALPFDSAHAAAQHAWKTQDEDHDDLEDLDTALEEVLTDGKSPNETVAENGTETVNEHDAETVDEPPTEAVADGGSTGLGLGGPPDRSSRADGSDDGDDDDGPSTLACPSCGTDTGATADDLEDGKTYRCTECGNKFRWSS